MKPNSVYTKHAYWLTEAEERHLKEKLKDQGVKLKEAKGVVCTPLDEINKISSVAPGIWNETCSRQGSWYRASDKNGLYLIVSSFEVEGYEEKKAAVITKSGFVPPRSATWSDKEDLVRAHSLIEKMPRAWAEVEDLEKRIYLRWARRFGSDLNDYSRLYLTHTANHANFIEPRFFIEQDHLMVPYSIDTSAHLCSCCLELFQILGSRYTEKLVRPCPGACIYARLKPDEFLLVKSDSQGS